MLTYSCQFSKKTDSKSREFCGSPSGPCIDLILGTSKSLDMRISLKFSVLVGYLANTSLSLWVFFSQIRY